MTELLAGPNSVREALWAERRHVQQVIVTEHVSRQSTVADILELCRKRDIPWRETDRSEMDRLAGELTHQGVVAEVSDYVYTDLDTVLEQIEGAQEPGFLLVLDSIQDPQNLGALMRTAEAVGVHGIVIPSRRAAQITPAVSRASAGAVEHLQVCRVTNIARTLEHLKQSGLWAIGVEEHPDAQDYRLVDLDMPLALVMGSEGEGMRRLVAETCDLLVRIPMRGQINSLNVSVAGAIALYRALDARHPAASS